MLVRPHGLDPAEVYRKTGGNPFYVTEVVRAGGAEVPAAVRDAVLARAARLDATARRLLECVAVVPSRVEPPLLRTLTGDAVVALDECLASGMLRAEDDAVAFRHEIARLAVEDAIPGIAGCSPPGDTDGTRRLRHGRPRPPRPPGPTVTRSSRR